MVRRLVRGLLLAAAMAVTLPIVAGQAGAVLGHAELVSSLPGAGQSLEEPPSEVTLVFSERLNELGTSVDVMDGDGRLLVRGGGERDPSDPRRLLVALPNGLEEGLYTVAWRSLSQDDGHSAQGFFNFGIGATAVPGERPHGGDVHRGHGASEALVETVARILGQLGALLGVGLLVAAAGIARALGGDMSRRLLTWLGAALIGGGIGAAMLLPLVASSASLAIDSYALATLPGNLLLARMAAGIVAGGAVLAMADRYPRAGWLVGGAGGVTLLALSTSAGHASAFGSVVPLAVMAVHVAAAGTWLAGLWLLAWLALADKGAHRSMLPVALPRFSALALVAVGLFVLTGTYSAWLMSGQLVDLASPYGQLVLIKVSVAIVALAIGALNYSGWRSHSERLGLKRRLTLEAGLALGVVIVTGLLASGTPPGPLRPIAIAPATTTAASQLDASLGLLPARPGPNRAFVSLANGPLPPGATLEMVLDRLDQQGQTRMPLQPLGGTEASAWTTDFLAPAGSRWDASVRLVADGAERARARFVFGLGDAGLSDGRQMPLIGFLTLVGLVLGGAGILLATGGLAGGTPPRTDPRLARRTMVAGAAVALVLAAAVLLLPGPVL